MFQYGSCGDRKADDAAFSAQMARAFLSGKVAGCRNVLSRVLRDHSDKIDAEQVKQAAESLGRVAAATSGKAGFGCGTRC